MPYDCQLTISEKPGGTHDPTKIHSHGEKLGCLDCLTPMPILSTQETTQD